MKSKVPEFRNNIKRISLTVALVAVAAGIMAVLIAHADSLAINFETYTPGSIQGQNGWGGQNPSQNRSWRVTTATSSPHRSECA